MRSSRAGALLFACLLASRGAAKPDDRKAEYTVKAGILHKLGLFVTWPDRTFPKADSPIVLGVLGSDPFGPILDKLSKKPVGRRKLVVRRIETAREGRKCNLVFIAESEEKRLAKHLKGLGGAGVLIVGDMGDVAKRGAAIGMRMKKGKVALEFNLKAARASGLRIDARLLKLGTVVEK